MTILQDACCRFSHQPNYAAKLQVNVRPTPKALFAPVSLHKAWKFIEAKAPKTKVCGVLASSRFLVWDLSFFSASMRFDFVTPYLP